MTTTMTVDQAVCETLSRYGVEYIFGMRIYTDLDTSRTRPVNIHHETSAELMAYGYARVSGKPGVCAINRPGTPNAIMGLAEAYNSSVPIIVLQDALPATMHGKHALYEHDQLGMMKPVAKWVGEVSTPAQAPEMLRKAFRIATSGRPGPVVLLIRGIAEQKLDLEGDLVVEPYTAFPATRTPPDPALIVEAVRLLRGAKRPCIIAGGGVNMSRAWAELRELVDLAQIPVATTISGKGSIAETHPLAAGVVGQVQGGRLGRGRVAARVVLDSDVILLVGTRTNQMATSNWTVPDRSSTIIQIDIDPIELGRNYPLRLGIVADARLALRALTEAWQAERLGPVPSRTTELADLLSEWARDNEAMERSDAIPIQPARLINEIRPFVDANTILVSDGSSPFMWASSHLKMEAGITFISPRGTGAIGTGLPMAIGAKFAAPQKRVICFEGDGGIMCGPLAELETAARYDLGMAVVVFNNGSYLHEKNRMRGPLREEMDFLPGIDFATVARGLKCEGIRVERPEEIAPAMRRALEGRKPTVVDVVIDHAQGFPAE